MSHRLLALLAASTVLVLADVAASASTTIVTPGENGALSMKTNMTYIAPSSPRPGGRYGFLYLGNGGASASYTVYAPTAGTYALWIRFDDDGLHPAGARTVAISVNGAPALTWSNPSQQTNGWVNIHIGALNLAAGNNSIVFTKPQQTSAAFVMDEFVLTDAPGYVPG
jgi:hypothetical protein